MSTTNIDEQKMQQINSSDTITQFMEKCNNNFSNIFRYRSGPEGKQGVEGSQGVPTKPKVPIHVWRKGVEYYNETSSGDGYVINDCKVDLTDIKYQEGHLIMLKNGHVYILEEYENSTLKPNYIMALQSYNQDDVIDGRSSYIHIAYTNSTDDYYDFITNEELQKQENVGNGEIKYKYMGLYSNYEEESSPFPETYTWIRIVGDTGEKGDKGDKGDTPTSTSVEVVGYSLEDLDLDSKNWEKTISELGELKPGTPIYIKNRYTWNDGTVTYGKTVTMAGTQGIKGETGRVLFYLGSFSDGTLTGKSVKGYLNEYRCDYYIDATGQAWMRTGTSEIADGHMFGKDNIGDNWVPSDKVGFLQAGAISADMINVETLAANKAFIDEMVANKAFIGEIVADTAFIEKIQSTEISADKISSGKISSDDGKSYFDLDTGDFVLGNDNGAALKYTSETGTLTIGGINDDADVQSLMYLKDALANDTDIKGGLIATSQIQLRDWTGEYLDDDKTQKEYKVNAGISGIENDNVLLWGGGTYDEAYEAANNDSYDTGNGAITTLFKKDGTGKIGVFHIEEDQVQVKTSDGTVVIDDIDGLSCKIQSQENAAVLVTPKELKTFEELKKLGETIDETKEYKNKFNNDLTYTIHESFGPKYAYSNSKVYDVFVGSGGKINVYGNIGYNSLEIPERYKNYINIGDRSYDGIWCEIYNSKGEEVIKGFISEDNQSFIDVSVESADTYTVVVCAQIIVNFDLSMLSQEELEQGITVKMSLRDDDTFFKIRRQYQIAEQQTMVAYKGIFSYQGDNAYFYYKDGVGLDCQIGNVRFSVNNEGILINGLKKSSSGLTKGMLYDDNGTLKIVQ